MWSEQTSYSSPSIETVAQADALNGVTAAGARRLTDAKTATPSVHDKQTSGVRAAHDLRGSARYAVPGTNVTAHPLRRRKIPRAERLKMEGRRPRRRNRPPEIQ